MPHISPETLAHVRTVLATASDQVERAIAYGWDQADHHGEFHRAKRALSEYLHDVDRQL